MIIKSFKLFEDLESDKNIFIVEINDHKDLEYTLNYLKNIDERMYNSFLLDNDWEYPNWLFIYKYDDRYDQCLIFSVNPHIEDLKDRMQRSDNIYQHIFKKEELFKLKKHLLGKDFIKNMYIPKKFER